MKDKKLLVLLIFLAIIGSVMLFLLRPLKNTEGLGAKDKESLQQNVIKLQSQVKQLQGLLRGFVLVNHSINTTFLKEKNQRGDLEKLLKDITAQNEILTQGLTQSRVSLELTKELRGKVDAAEKLIAGSQLKETNFSLTTKLTALGEQLNDARGDLSKAVMEKETEIKQNRETLQRAKQLEDAILGLTQKNQTLENELPPLKNQLEALKEEKLRLTKEIEEAKAAGQNAVMLQEQLKQLQARSEELSKNYADLKNEYAKADETIKQNTLALGKRADRILVLSEKLTETQSGLKDIRSKYQEIEKESAALREQNVAAQLEREELKIQLTQTRVKLKEFESQASQITNILNNIRAGETSADLPQEQEDEGKTVKVELYQSQDSSENAEADLLLDSESAGTIADTE